MSDIVVRNPRTGETLYTLGECTDTEVAQVYDRAWKTFNTLRKMTVRQRLDELLKLKRYLVENKETVVTRICEETGKSRTDALLTEIFASLDLIDFYDRTAEKTLAEQPIPTRLLFFPKKSKIYYEPLGPVLVIAPWNYPLVLSFQPIICALVAGNPVILKSSSYTPLRGVYEDMVNKSGFVKNALQVVYGTRVTGNKLIEAKPRKICFTGSVGAGKKVMAQAAEHLIPVELELGGKDPMIVFDDVNLERAVNGALWGGFLNCGQTCTSVERVYVQEGIYDAFVAMLREKAAKISTLDVHGSAKDEGDLMMGCMTAGFQVKTVEEQLADAAEKGAQIAARAEHKPGAHVFSPTIVTGVDPTMKVQMEETFGPVVTVTKFKAEEEAIRLANDSPYGLSASVWSADLERADRVARAIETGNVSINNVLATQGNSALPFGGFKDSGFGRYKGAHGLLTFCNVKSILVDKNSSKIELNWYPYSKKKYALFTQLIDAMFGDGPLKLLRSVLVGLKIEALAKKERL